MKKLFRFQYEKCSGTCYHPSPEFFEELRCLDKTVLKRVVDKVVASHDRVCNDPEMRFGVDYDEKSKHYIASFVNHGKLDLFTSRVFMGAVEEMCEFILSEVQGGASGDCEYDHTTEKLHEAIMRAV